MQFKTFNPKNQTASCVRFTRPGQLLSTGVNTLRGTLPWTAPEIIRNPAAITEKVRSVSSIFLYDACLMIVHIHEHIYLFLACQLMVWQSYLLKMLHGDYVEVQVAVLLLHQNYPMLLICEVTSQSGPIRWYKDPTIRELSVTVESWKDTTFSWLRTKLRSI